MTIENYQYRTNPLFLRNQFLGGNIPWQIPDIPKCTLTLDELDGLRLIGYDRAKNGNDEHFQRMVHFFLYDYKFEDIWIDPAKRVEALKKYRAVLTPDFSMYLELHPVLQLYNTFRNRWVGAYLAAQGIKVVPTVNWGNESTFDFCFAGIAYGSAVAVSTYMAHAHSTCKEQKEWFLRGYNAMMQRIEPSVVICYSDPFPEMRGNIIHVDYDLSSWKHDEDDIDKALAEEPQTGFRVVKRGYVLHKGGGSAYEGDPGGDPAGGLDEVPEAGGELEGGQPDFPGWDPQQPPPGYDEWRGQEPEGGDKGAWYNPETGESMHPDLEHGEPEGPHWDYNDGLGGHFRIDSDGSISPKSFEGDMIYA